MKFLSGNFYKKLFSSKRFTLPFSLLLAFIFWLGITISQKPTMQRTFADIAVNINLENTYVAENEMSIVGDISNQKFTVVVRGPNHVVSALTSNDFNLYASAAEVDSPGNYSLQVNATRNNNNSQYEILSITPPTLDVNFDYMETKEFTITALAEGAAAAEGLIVETGVVGGTESDTITISGPRTTINSINKVVAVAEVNKTLTASETFDASVILFDDGGKKISQKDLSLSTTNVKVTVPISKKKTVPVVVQFTNLPKGFDKSTLKTTVNHNEVTVIGTPDAVDKTTSVLLSPIDITKVSLETSTFDVSAKLPDGVRLLDNIEFFTVNIDTTGYAEKSLNVTLINHTGVSAGLSIEGNSIVRNVKIIGPKSAVNKFNTQDIVADFDLSNKKSGEHTVTAAFTINEYTNVWVVGTYDTTVTIK